MIFKNLVLSNTIPKKPDSFYAWAAFIAFYSWFNVIFFNFNTSPLRYLALSMGITPESVVSTFFIYFGVGSLLKMLFLSDRVPKLIFMTLQYIWTGLSFLMLVIHHPPVFHYLIIIQGFCAGIIFPKIVFDLIFFTPKKDWVRNTIITYTFVQSLIYLYLVFPVKSYPGPAYIGGAFIQILCCYFFYRFSGSILAVRRIIPPVDIKLKPLILPILTFVIFLTCSTVVKDYVMPSFQSNSWVSYYQIIPNALTLFVIYRWGGKWRQDQFLQIGALLMGLTFATTQLFKGSLSGRFVAETLMQPAYLCWDVYMYSLVGDLTYKHGKKYLHGRSIFLSIVMVMALSETSISLLLSKIPIGYSQIYIPFYIFVFILLYLIPSLKTYLEREFSIVQNESFSPASSQNQAGSEPVKTAVADSSNAAESGASRAVSLGNPTSRRSLAKMSKTLPPGVSLTQREQEVLEQLCEKQDNDVIGNILGISKNTLKVHLKSLYTKFKVRSRAELYVLMGLNESGPELTKREKEVRELLRQGKNAEQIARKLDISTSTARQHIWNIRQKTALLEQKDSAASGLEDTLDK